MERQPGDEDEITDLVLVPELRPLWPWLVIVFALLAGIGVGLLLR